MRKGREGSESRAWHPKAPHAAAHHLNRLHCPHRRLHAASEPFLSLKLRTLFCRPEAFSPGDRLRLTVRTGARERDLPRIFQARPQDSLLHERSAAFQDSKACPSLKILQGSSSPSKRDDGVIRGLQTRSPGSSLRCRFISLQPGCGMFTHSLSANL